MLFLLYLVLALPIFVSQSYSGNKDNIWLLLALASLGLALILIRHVSRIASKPWIRNTLFSSVCIGIGVFQFARLTSFFFQGESFNTRFFFHFSLSSVKASWAAYAGLLSVSILFLLLIGFLAYFTISRTPLKAKPNISIKGFGVLLCGFLIFSFMEPDILQYSQYKYRLLKNNQPVLLDESLLISMGLNKQVIVPPFNTIQPGKNLLFIYLESLEGTYLDENKFANLTPNFTAFAKAGLNFTNMHQTPGTDFTMGGIVSSQCGTPLLFEATMHHNDVMQGGFLNNIPCLGDILNTAGYRQSFIGGASTQFAGKGRFLLNHHYDEVLGKEELIPGLADPDFHKGWGLYDESILETASTKFFELAETGKPFNLTVLTLDTHHPVGRPSPACPKYDQIDNSILHSVHCSDFLIKKFIDSISDHPAFKDTLVVLFSDHYAMRNEAQEYYPKVSERRLFLTILNSEETGEVDSFGVHMDLAPTLLSLLNIEHGAEFLTGQDLLASTPRTEERNWWAEDRLDTIRYINSNLFTNPSLPICQEDEIIRKVGNQIEMAGKAITLSVWGTALPDKALSTTHGFLSFWGQGGFVKRTMVLKNNAIAQQIYKNKPNNFLLIMRPDALPGYLKAYVSNLQAEVVALIGNPNGDVLELQLENPEGEFVSRTSDCEELLREIDESTSDIELISNEEQELDLPTIGNYSKVDFSKNLRRYVPEGFWAAKPFGRWTKAKKSSLSFKAANDFCKNSYLAIKGNQFFEGVDPDSLEIYLNNEKLEALNLNAEKNIYYFDCSSFDVSPGSSIRLEVRTDKVVSPFSLGTSPDRRVLGFNIASLGFVDKKLKPFITF